MKANIFSQLFFFLIGVLAASYGCTSQPATETGNTGYPSHLYEYSDNLEPRWSSFENLNGVKGQGGKENNGAKGHPFDVIRAGGRVVLLDTRGPGLVNRIWITIRDRTPEVLRGLVINMYWDEEGKPAVSVPFGDFFSIGLGETMIYENALFANPEGRSFNSFVQMPFEKAARIEIVNELPYDVPLLFFDVDYQLLKHWDDQFLYFHAYWHRDTATTLGEDFNILPALQGKGRFLGMNVSLVSKPEYKDYWWGEGEVKIYLNGDDEFPTLAGTGTEDYIGTAWGQGKFFNKYTGCSIADTENQRWSFYRFHLIDPIYFSSDCRVTLQQMGGTVKKDVVEMLKNGERLIPVTISGSATELIHLYDKENPVNLEDPGLPGDDAWVNFYRSDDVSAVAYFYFDQPANELPEIQDLAIRTWNLKD